MKLSLALRELHRSELRLARTLESMAARHHADHGIRHVATDLAGWSREHVALVSQVAHRYGADLREHPHTLAYTGRFQAWLADRLGRRPEPALVLLADLRRLHRLAAGVSLDWELLAQGAQAVKVQELVELTQHCHPQSLRQMGWANAMLKELSPQAMAN